MADLIPVDPGAPFALGRAAREDDPRNFLYAALVKPPQRHSRPHPVWYSPDVYNQLNSPQCTVEETVGQLHSSKYRYGFREHWPKFDTFEEKRSFYLHIQRHDPASWGPHDGALMSSPLKELKLTGIISGYRWLFGEEELWEWVTWYGVAGIGVEWLEQMFYPDSKHFISPDGPSAGGHAIRVVYTSPTKNAYRLVNSWGKGWGENGRCWVTREDMKYLLEERHGEALVIA